MWQIPKMWSEERCWIIGGGVSFPTQFGVPDDVIDRVTNGELSPYAYIPWLKPLQNEHVIGTNIAYLLGESIVDILLFSDPPFFRTNHGGIDAFSGLKVTCARLGDSEWPEHQNDILILRKDLKQGIESKRGDRVRWNGHTGGAAINLAVLLGCKEIYLLGFDMKSDEKGRTHWHGRYKGKTKDVAFNTFQKSFQFISRDANRLGVQIVNANPDSAVVEFPKVSVKDILDPKKSIFIPQKPAEELLGMRRESIESYKRGSKDKGKGVMHKYKILSLFHEIYNPQLYFEIGVDRGVSIRLAKCKAIGVDPEPKISSDVNGAEIHSLKSDTFFEGDFLNKRIPDLVFIDGLHHFDQVLRDFRNTERNCRSGTIIVLDDVLPSHPDQTKREFQSGAWTGDVWKVVPILRQYRPDLKMILLDSNPTGLLAITNLDSKNTVLWDTYNEVVEEWMDKEVPDSFITREGLDVKKNIEEEVRSFGIIEKKKILCFVNHYYNPTQKEGFKGGSTNGDSKRERIVKTTISRLKDISGCDVKVCGLKEYTVPGIDVDIDFTGIQPWNLVYESLNYMSKFIKEYDYFINVEDDIFVGNDVIQNVIDFDKTHASDEILFPNRIEIEEDETYQFVDLKSKWKKDSNPSSFKGIPLNIANNCHSGILILSTEKYKNAYSMLDPTFREVWWGGPMASAYAYFHSGFQLYRNSNLTKFHSIIHLDHWQSYKENDMYSRSGEARIQKAKEIVNQVKHHYKPIKVEICYGLDMKLAEAYNEAMETAATDWVLLLDHDVIVGLNPHWYEMCVFAINNVRDEVGLITCVSNYRPRRKSKGSQFPDIRIDSTDVNAHIKVARQLYTKFGTDLRKINTYKVAGFFMLVRKSAWEKVKFKNVGRGVDQIDWNFGTRLIEQGYTMYEMPGLYVYHHRDIRKMDWGKPILESQDTEDLPVKFGDWIHYYMKHPYPNYDYNRLINKHHVKELVQPMVKVAKELAHFTDPLQIDEFDYSKLPKSFVIKATHGSHMNIIVKDGVEQISANQRQSHPFNLSEAKVKMKQWLEIRFADGGELYYDKVDRGVLIEENLCKYFTDYEREYGIVDYKAWCFHGRIEFIATANYNGTKVNYYDTDWNEMPFRRDDRTQLVKFPKPANLKQIIETVNQLLDVAKNPPFVRVDLYNFGMDTYFGEFTHSPGKGDKSFIPLDPKQPRDWYELQYGKAVKEALTIICFKWNHSVGEPLPAVARGIKYDASYVNRLYKAFQKNLTIPHRFVCVTDDPEGVECETYPLWDWGREFGRCFTRLKMFDPEMRKVFGKRVACIDLDTVVIGNLDNIFSRTENFIIHTYYPDSHQYQQKYNGSLFMMDMGCRSEVFTKFEGQKSVELLKQLQEEKKINGSDQGWINYVLGNNESRFGEDDGVYHLRNIMHPGRDSGRRRGDLPKDARLVMFSGNQDPSMGVYQKYDWVKKNWL